MRSEADLFLALLWGGIALSILVIVLLLKTYFNIAAIREQAEKQTRLLEALQSGKPLAKPPPDPDSTGFL